jgi:hypothetical protein
MNKQTFLSFNQRINIDRVVGELIGDNCISLILFHNIFDGIGDLFVMMPILKSNLLQLVPNTKRVKFHLLELFFLTLPTDVVYFPQESVLVEGVQKT